MDRVDLVDSGVLSLEQHTEPLMVKVTFTDYLTGKVFKEQKIIKP